MASIQEGRLGGIMERFYEAATQSELWTSVL